MKNTYKTPLNLLGVTVLISFGLVSAVYAGQIMREPVGHTGHYLAENGYKNQVEDADGNVLYSDDYGVEVADKRFELYETYLGYLTADMKHIVLPAYSHTCIYFDNFDILAYMMKDGQTDPTDTENTRYFDTDGNEIADVYEYISGRGAEPKDGIYAETICGVRQLRRFVKKTNYPGVPDMFAPSDRKVCPRMKIGNTGHYLCGNEVDKEGMGGSWIEDESGKDLYWRMLGNMGYAEIYALDTSEEKYLVKEHHLQGDMGYYQILDSDLNVIETGESFSCDPTGEGFITPINAEITVPEVEFNDDDFVDPEQMEVFFKDKIITGSADKDEPMIIQTEDDSEPISDVSQDLADVDPTAYLPSVLGWTFAVCGIFIIFALFMILKR